MDLSIHLIDYMKYITIVKEQLLLNQRVYADARLEEETRPHNEPK